MTPLLGIDGCRAGWIVASAEDALDSVGFSLAPSLDVVFDLVDRTGALVAIDVPIGLSEDGTRDCDLAARAFLKGPRKSSVFPAPCRATLAARDYHEACALNLRASGKMVTKELYYILPKIREVDLLLSPSRQSRVHESHPEVVFAALAGADAAPLPPKRHPEGQAPRIEILRRFLPAVSLASLHRERSRLASGRATIALDDLIDALACLVTAHRLSAGVARVFPNDEPRRDARGLRMEIIA